MHKKLSIFMVLLLLLSTTSFGQTNTFEYSDTAIYQKEESIEEEVEVKTYTEEIKIPDTSFILNPVIDLRDSIAKWKKEKSLVYLQSLDSLLLMEQLEDEAASNNTLNTAEKGVGFFDSLFRSDFFKILLWLIAGIVLFFILYKLFLSKGLFSRAEKEKKNVEELPEEELLQLGNYDKLIQDAIQASDYRLATRYLFLQSLKKMSDKEIIFYAADKTNREYMQQLPEHLQSGFRNIARHYDYIWYGHQTLETNNFKNIQQIFKQFNQAF